MAGGIDFALYRNNHFFNTHNFQEIGVFGSFPWVDRLKNYSLNTKWIGLSTGPLGIINHSEKIFSSHFIFVVLCLTSAESGAFELKS